MLGSSDLFLNQDSDVEEALRDLRAFRHGGCRLDLFGWELGAPLFLSPQHTFLDVKTFLSSERLGIIEARTAYAVY